MIDALNDKNILLEKQEDLLYDEHDKFVEAQKSLALEIKRNEMLACEVSTCHDSISNLKSINDDLNAKLVEANKSNSCVEYVEICTRCKDIDINACSEHLVSISKLNDELASLNAQLKTSKSNFDKLKFARDAYTVGRHPSIKDGLGFKREAKNLTSQRAPIFNKEKGKAPMAISSQKNHAFIYDKLKFARDAYTIGRHPSIKNGLGFKREAKNLTSHKAPIPAKEKGKAPMASSTKRNHAFMYHDRRQTRNAYRSYNAYDDFDSHAMFASSSSYMHGRNMSRR